MPRKQAQFETSRVRIARNVFAIRNTRGLSQGGLAEAAGMHRSYVGDIENAVRNVSIDNIDRLAIALGVDPQDLLASRGK